jgi:hypothetical protein
MQRELVMAVAGTTLSGDDRAEIGQLHATTNDLAGRRNDVIHSIIGIGGPLLDLRIVATGVVGQPKLSEKDIEAELASLLEGLQLLDGRLSNFWIKTMRRIHPNNPLAMMFGLYRPPESSYSDWPEEHPLADDSNNPTPLPPSQEK